MSKEKPVTIVDAGSGNLLSVLRACEKVGATPKITATEDDILAAERLILPGVGAFGHVMDEISKRGLKEAIRRFAATGRPYLGICVGMQIMLDESHEFGRHEGLGFVPGVVEAIPDTGSDGTRHKVPHVGWGELTFPDAGGNGPSLFTGVAAGASVYFVHSFVARPKNPSNVAASTRYNGIDLCAAVRTGPLWGCQFHPEKSGPTGLRVLQNFIEFT